MEAITGIQGDNKAARHRRKDEGRRRRTKTEEGRAGTPREEETETAHTYRAAVGRHNRAIGTVARGHFPIRPFSSAPSGLVLAVLDEARPPHRDNAESELAGASKQDD